MKNLLTIALRASMVFVLFVLTACSSKSSAQTPPAASSPSVSSPSPTGQSSPTAAPVSSPTTPVVPPQSPAEAPKTMEFASAPSAVQLHVGDQFVFGLESNPSMGYIWQMAPGTDERVVKLSSQENIQPPASTTPRPVGMPEIQKFTFAATGQGQTTITLNYVHPWEKEAAPAKTQVINVAVSPTVTPPSMVLHVGEQIVFSLESNPSTGYKWAMAPGTDENVVKLSSQEYIQPPAPTTTPPPVGAPGSERFTFTGTGKGRTTVTLNYVRPWEKDAVPAKTQAFNVIVE